MAIPANVVKHVISGTLPGGEIFQTAYWINAVTAPSVTNASEAALAASSPMVALFNALKPMMSTNTVITALDGYGYTGGGAASSHGHATVSITGTGTQTHPDQIACVCTLRTATAGRRTRGRMYFPATGLLVDGAGLMSSTVVNGVVTALAGLFTAAAGGAAPAVVVSQTGSSTANITSVDADYVPDTQRRRSNKLHTVRFSATV